MTETFRPFDYQVPMIQHLLANDRAALLFIAVLDFASDLICKDRLEPFARPASANPRMGSCHRTSEDGGKACGSKCKAVVPGHAGILPPKKKNAMRKITLVMEYAMRRIGA